MHWSLDFRNRLIPYDEKFVNLGVRLPARLWEWEEEKGVLVWTLCKTGAGSKSSRDIHVVNTIISFVWG